MLTTYTLYYIRVMVTLAPEPFDTLVVVPEIVTENSLHGLVPLTALLVTVPPEIPYVYIIDEVSLLTVQVTKPGSLMVNSAPTIVSLMLVMFGSAPAKLRYLRCQGRLPLLIVTLPAEHLRWVSSVM